METGVVSFGRTRPHWSKGQWLAIPRLRRSYAAALNRKESWLLSTTADTAPTASKQGAAELRVSPNLTSLVGPEHQQSP